MASRYERDRGNKNKKKERSPRLSIGESSSIRVCDVLGVKATLMTDSTVSGQLPNLHLHVYQAISFLHIYVFLSIFKPNSIYNN
ncbi:hypothetical protein BLOT_004407 [Blomia tropicalis]|nr:hypothetical protein BLOT_004407 [Blomia tropicalis]